MRSETPKLIKHWPYSDEANARILEIAKDYTHAKAKKLVRETLGWNVSAHYIGELRRNRVVGGKAVADEGRGNEEQLENSAPCSDSPPQIPDVVGESNGNQPRRPRGLITFNDVLRSVGIDPTFVKLVRHQKQPAPNRPTPFQLWKAGNGEYERYQQTQGRPVFDGARLLASFVVTPFNETIFVGIYRINGVGTVPVGMKDAISGDDVSGLLFYDLTPVEELTEYRGKIVIEWGEGYRAWVQSARKQDKPVIEIRRTVEDPPFPGLLEFRERLSVLPSIPFSWRQVLSSVSGVYLLVCPESGRQYVGSANGVVGFWGRWMDYVTTGHGGNLRMKEALTADYQVTILEVASSSVSLEELVMMENRWKRKLLSRDFGLNAN